MKIKVTAAVCFVLALLMLCSCNAENTDEKSVTARYSGVCTVESFDCPSNFTTSHESKITSDGVYIYINGYTDAALDIAANTKDAVCRFDIDGTNAQITEENDIDLSKFPNYPVFDGLSRSDEIRGTVELSDGNTVALVAHPNISGVSVYYINAETNAIGDKVMLPEELTATHKNAQLYAGAGYDLYIKNDTGLYGYNIGGADSENGGDAVEIINWLNSDIYGPAIVSLYVLTDSEFLYAYSDYNGDSDIGKLTLIPQSELREKTLITLATMTTALPSHEKMILSFNRSSDKYRIVISDYSVYDEEQRVLMFNADIAAGNIPDIFVYGISEYAGGYPIAEYKKMGLFADYFELFAKDGDTTASAVNSVVTSAFAENGKLYSLPLSFYLTTAVGSADNFPSDSWTMIDMIERSENLGEGQLLTDDIGKLFSADGTIFDFIDYENGKVNFDDDNFKRIVEFQRDYYKNPLAPGAASSDARRQMLRDGTLLLSCENIGMFFDVAYLKSVFGGDVKFMGYPAQGGGKSYVKAETYYSVSAKSNADKADGAWEFIKFMLADESLDPSIAGNSERFPVTQRGMDKYIEECMRTTYAIMGPFRRWIYSNPMTDDEAADLQMREESEGITATSVTLTRGEIDAFLSVMSKARPSYETDATIEGMYREEMLPYLFDRGDKSFEESVKILKSRVEIYLSEKN